MPSATPTKAERTASPTVSLRRVARAPWGKGKANRPMKNNAPSPDRSAIPVKGSTPDAIAGRANKVPSACPRAVATPRTIPCGIDLNRGRAGAAASGGATMGVG